jgi:hypothetical protein
MGFEMVVMDGTQGGGLTWKMVCARAEAARAITMVDFMMAGLSRGSGSRLLSTQRRAQGGV